MQNLYKHFDKDGNLLYVGISLNSINRLAQHQCHAHWFEKIVNVKIEQFDSRAKAIEAEREAITNENPLHNLYRPRPKEQKKVENTQKRADESRAELFKGVVRFNLLYTVSGVAQLLDTSSNQVKEWIKDNKLGSIFIKKTWNAKRNREIITRKVTGWQIIDFLENLQSGEIKYLEVPVNGLSEDS